MRDKMMKDDSLMAGLKDVVKVVAFITLSFILITFLVKFIIETYNIRVII